jgi:hypothetical protein
MVETYNPSYLAGRDWEDHSSKLPRQKVTEIPCQSISQEWLCLPVPQSQLCRRMQVGDCSLRVAQAKTETLI